MKQRGKNIFQYIGVALTLIIVLIYGVGATVLIKEINTNFIFDSVTTEFEVVNDGINIDKGNFKYLIFKGDIVQNHQKVNEFEFKTEDNLILKDSILKTINVDSDSTIVFRNVKRANVASHRIIDMILVIEAIILWAMLILIVMCIIKVMRKLEVTKLRKEESDTQRSSI